MFKLQLQLECWIFKKHIISKSKSRWHYNHLPEKVAEGFTLAEVLLTLAVIGILAAMTIPSLMQSTQDREMKAAWKKTFAVLSSAYSQLVTDNGGSYFLFGNNLANDINPYLSYAKKGGYGNIPGNFWSKTFKELNGNSLSVITTYVAGNGNASHCFSSLVDSTLGCLNMGSGFNASSDIGTGYLLNDGTFLVFTGILGKPNQIYIAQAAVDVNGFKGPNTIGKDIFYLYFIQEINVSGSKNYVMPAGSSFAYDIENVYPDSCKNAIFAEPMSGIGCSAKYLRE